MNDPSQSVEVRVDGQGQVVIPAALLQRLGWTEGDSLVAHGEVGRLVLEKPARQPSGWTAAGPTSQPDDEG